MKGIASALTAGILLGSVGVLARFGLESAGPISLTWLRAIAAVFVTFLLMVIIDKGHIKRLTRKKLRRLVPTGFALGFSMLAFIAALNYISVANAILITYLFPTLTAFLAMCFLHERVTRFTWIALMTSFLGVGFIFYPDLTVGTGAMLGNLLAIVGAIFAASYVILARYDEKNCTVEEITFWPLVVSVIILLPFALMEGGGTLVMSTGALLPAVGLGIVTALGYFTYDLALKYIEAHLTAIFGMLTEVLSAIVLAAIFLGEWVGLNAIAGGALILLAGIMAQRELSIKAK